MGQLVLDELQEAQHSSMELRIIGMPPAYLRRMGEVNPKATSGGARPHGGLSARCLERGKLSPHPDLPPYKEAGTGTVTVVVPSLLLSMLCKSLQPFRVQVTGGRS